MKVSQFGIAFWRMAVALSAVGAAIVVSAAPAAAARPAAPAGASTHVLSQSAGRTANGAAVAATTCTVSISAPVRAGASSVAVDYSVMCDQEVLGIAGFIAIFRVGSATPLGNTVDQFNFGQFGGGEQIVRGCVNGTLYGLIRVVVNFKTGFPRTIDANFYSPVAGISC